MPEPTRQIRRGATTRPQTHHAGFGVDPVLIRKGKAHPGGLIVASFGILFVAYIFNFGGLKVFLDGFFSGLNSAARSKNDVVAAGATSALPYLGVVAGVVLLLFILMLMGRGAKTGKKRKKAAEKEVVLPVEGNTIIKPVRLALRERAEVPMVE